MNKNQLIIFSIVLISFLSCGPKTAERKEAKPAEKEFTDLQVDHLNIWVANPQKAKEKLQEIGFAFIPDSLSAIHHGQGTAGKYANFLNSYLELIYVYDSIELKENNQQNPKLDFVARANNAKNGASPFSIALKIKDYDTTKIPFQKVRYYQDWMEEEGSIYTAENSLKQLGEPSIFVVYPSIEHKTFDNLQEVERIPDEYAFWRESFKHPNGAKKLTKITIQSNDLNDETATIKAVNKIESLSVQKGATHLMELYFDHNVQQKIIDLRPELLVLIHL